MPRMAAPRQIDRPRPRMVPTRLMVVETYLYEVRERGERGAFGRVVEYYTKECGRKYSDEWARLHVRGWQKEVAERETQREAEKPAPEPIADEIAYLPPPGYEDLEREREAVRKVARRERRAADTVVIMADLANFGVICQELRQVVADSVLTDDEKWIRLRNAELRELAKQHNLEVDRQLLERDDEPLEEMPNQRLANARLWMLVCLLLGATCVALVPLFFGTAFAWAGIIGTLGLGGMFAWVGIWYRDMVLEDVRGSPQVLIDVDVIE